TAERHHKPLVRNRAQRLAAIHTPKVAIADDRCRVLLRECASNETVHVLSFWPEFSVNEFQGRETTGRSERPAYLPRNILQHYVIKARPTLYTQSLCNGCRPAPTRSSINHAAPSAACPVFGPRHADGPATPSFARLVAATAERLKQQHGVGAPRRL